MGILKICRPPLFCIHPVSGMAWCYAEMAQHLDGRRVYGVQASGPGELPGTIAALAERYVHALRSIQPQGPYHLLGWSLGGTLAQEMAVQLTHSGAEVGSVVMLDTLPPEMIPIRQSAPTPGRIDARARTAGNRHRHTQRVADDIRTSRP